MTVDNVSNGRDLNNVLRRHQTKPRVLEILSKKRFSDPEISHTFRGLVSQFYQKVNFATVDDDTSKDVAKKYKITVGNRAHFVLMDKDGNVLKKLHGPSASTLEQEIKALAQGHGNNGQGHGQSHGHGHGHGHNGHHGPHGGHR